MKSYKIEKLDDWIALFGSVRFNLARLYSTQHARCVMYRAIDSKQTANWNYFTAAFIRIIDQDILNAKRAENNQIIR